MSDHPEFESILEAYPVKLENFEGPLDLLLELARGPKVDLSRISILALVEQYLAVVEGVRRVRLELAAGWLEMAAWLAWLKSRLLLPRVREGRGTVVFVNSGAGLRANPGWSSYAASKFALRALADALRDEEARHGVRVTTVYPGRTATPMQRSVHEQEGRAYEPNALIQPADVAAVVKGALELPPTASVTDVTVRPPG